MRMRHFAIVAAVVLAAACESDHSSTAGISGFGASGSATHLVFSVQPSTTVAGAAIVPAVQVTAASGSGSTDQTFVNNVIVAIGANPGAGGLSGAKTVTAIAGVATFSNLSINNAGNGYTLTAAASNLGSATSAAFTVTP